MGNCFPASDVCFVAHNFHYLRNYLAHEVPGLIISSSTVAFSEPAPIDMGWKRGGAGLEPVLMSIAAIPESCLDMISYTCKT